MKIWINQIMLYYSINRGIRVSNVSWCDVKWCAMIIHDYDVDDVRMSFEVCDMGLGQFCISTFCPSLIQSAILFVSKIRFLNQGFRKKIMPQCLAKCW
jgi:hypothetical protein